jgi:proteasome activator subunit 4
MFSLVGLAEFDQNTFNQLVQNLAILASSSIGDAILQQDSKRVLKNFASLSVFAPSCGLIDFLEALMKLIDTSPTLGWQSRKSLVEFIRIFVARNYSRLSQHLPHLADQAMALIQREGNAEVRQEICDLLRIIFYSGPSVSREKSAELLQEIKQQRGNGIDEIELVRQHGLMLIASSLVLSSPYTLPPWVPDVLEAISSRLNYRHPVGPTVRKTFSEFKRTHADTWEQDRLLFRPDQLDLISELLVAPSYYA